MYYLYLYLDIRLLHYTRKGLAGESGITKVTQSNNRQLHTPIVCNEIWPCMVAHEYQQLSCLQNKTFPKKRLALLSKVIFIFKVRINLHFTFLSWFLLITKNDFTFQIGWYCWAMHVAHQYQPCLLIKLASFEMVTACFYDGMDISASLF